MKCPKKIQGKCCYFSCLLEGFNIILDKQPCKYLDTKTNLCSDYENRFNVSWCLKGRDMFNQGGLPKGCLYLKNHPERESNPKITFESVKKKLTPESVQLYDFTNSLANIEEKYNLTQESFNKKFGAKT